jgi:hypothetical protein
MVRVVTPNEQKDNVVADKNHSWLLLSPSPSSPALIILPRNFHVLHRYPPSDYHLTLASRGRYRQQSYDRHADAKLDPLASSFSPLLVFRIRARYLTSVPLLRQSLNPLQFSRCLSVAVPRTSR